ncbi:hypothetical protein N0V88_007281 [Collariella sp. IMI 366227]|nr:hypothetical protein N0V88_007281 [Collariella sp. IMI 366227]
MHHFTLKSLLAVSALVVVTVVVKKTVTTCPTPVSPLPCTSVSTGGSGHPSGTKTPSGSQSASDTKTASGSGKPSSFTTFTTLATSATSSVAPPACTDYLYEKIKHQGVAPFGGVDYKVFRNVKDFGAKGDGVTDDTDAINKAISDGKRCGPGCTGSTKTPGLIYFPPGTYMISSPIIDFYYTQLIGNPGCPPVLKATANFEGRWLLDTNPYQSSGSLAWGATNVFWRQVHNFVIDLTGTNSSALIAGIHWPSSQSTSLSNIEFKLSEASGTQHQGLFIEEGSGGYIGDLTFHGGAQAMTIGNQQFTMRNIKISKAKTAIQQLWSWGWTYQGVSIDSCEVGFDFTAASEGSLGVGSITILDSEIKNTPIGIAYGSEGATKPPVANNFVFENVRLDNVPAAIKSPAGTVLAGSTGASVIAAWGRGHKYTPSSSGPTKFEGTIPANTRPASLLSGSAYYTRSRPQYEDLPASEFLSARDAGAKGDGTTDDTAALNKLFATAASSNKVVFLDAGMYVVTSTLLIPANSRIFGEAFPVLLSSGPFFASASSPKPLVQVGTPGSQGRIEWSNTILSTRGAQPGAILLEYNLASPASSPSGLWDVHTRIGGFAGSDLQLAECAKNPNTVVTEQNLQKECIAAFMSVHITPSAAGVYMENCWVWVADHDIEEGANNEQITIYAGRGMLVEKSQGPLWLVASSVEHHQLYEYQFVGAANVYMGQIQTETAYYQPNPDASLPFESLEKYADPVLAEGESGQIGKGATCQKRIFSVEGKSQVRVYNLNTVGTNKMVTVDGKDVVNYEDNIDGFVHSVALFETE